MRAAASNSVYNQIKIRRAFSPASKCSFYGHYLIGPRGRLLSCFNVFLSTEKCVRAANIKFREKKRTSAAFLCVAMLKRFQFGHAFLVVLGIV